MGAVLLHEPILISMVVGGALVIAGVTLTNR
jgi:drug/metabolite transporter (DMT)-like permease